MYPCFIRKTLYDVRFPMPFPLMDNLRKYTITLGRCFRNMPPRGRGTLPTRELTLLLSCISAVATRAIPLSAQILAKSPLTDLRLLAASFLLVESSKKQVNL